MLAVAVTLVLYLGENLGVRFATTDVVIIGVVNFLLKGLKTRLLSGFVDSPRTIRSLTAFLAARVLK